jgi:hypothetical protein
MKGNPRNAKKTKALQRNHKELKENLQQKTKETQRKSNENLIKPKE